MGSNGDNNNNRERFAMHRHWIWVIPLVVASLVVFGMRVTSIKEEQVQTKPVGGIILHDLQCPSSKCSKVPLDIYKRKWGGDLSSTSFMLKRAQEERKVLVERLKQNYGEEYYPLFFLSKDGKTSIGVSGFHGAKDKSSVSRDRFVRKLAIKLLKVQLSVKEDRKDNNGGITVECDCPSDNDAATSGKRYLQGSRKNGQDATNAASSNLSFRQLDKLPNHYEKMVFVNGGHSSAAGHGNLLRETYAAVMEQSAKDVYAAVGIELEGRNYAMGGMASAPELALCSEAVYGTDADLITWNYGMTDGHEFWRHSLYGNRRGAHANRPLLLDMDIGENYAKGERVKVLRKLEEAGLATMYMNVSYFYDQDSKDFIPDMQTMKTQQEMDKIPEYLRYFRCGEVLEKGDPYCKEKKYSDDCAPHKAPWHPGWKAHALNGNILALFMIDVLLSALKEIEKQHVEGVATTDLLEEMQRQEDEEYERFFQSKLPGADFMDIFWNRTLITESFEPLFRNPIVCHTALLPAATRYQGILTDMKSNSTFEHHYIGTKRSELKGSIKTTDKSEMKLVYDDKVTCPEPVAAIDYKDYFFVSDKTGETSLTLPNKAERDAYLKGNPDHEFHGYVIVCFVSCPWGKCPEGNLGENEVNNGTATLSVNGVRVEEMVQIYQCSLLKHEDGFIWKPNQNGEYQLTAKVHALNGFMRFSSVIVV